MKRLFLTYGPAVLSGILLASAFPRFHLYFLAWVALVPVIRRALTLTPRQAAGHFFLAGWVFHTLLLQWLMTNIYWAGGWALLGQQLLCVALAVFWGALGALWIALRARVRWYGGAIGFALSWYTIEFIHARAFTGFGWSAVGYSQGPDLLFSQLASLGGVGLLSLLIFLVNALLALALAEKSLRWQRLAAVAGILLLAHGIGLLLLDEPALAEDPVRVGVLQSNFTMEMKWDPEYTEEMVVNAAIKSARLDEFEAIDLMVWPEALIMRSFDSPQFLPHLRGLCRESEMALFAGSVRRGEGASFNSSVLIGLEGEIIDYYDKVHLAPFGEYIPFEKYLPFLSQVVPGGAAGFGEGQKVLDVAGRRFGPLICFEVLFAPMSERLRAEGADFLVVITNLAWFGMSNAIPQELEIARFRAIETRLPLVHSANTGISGVFDPYGRFAVTDAVVTADGRYYKWERGPEDAPINPASTVMQRRVGAFDLPSPGALLLPGSTAIFPWLMTCFWLVMAVVAVVAYLRARPANHADGSNDANSGSREDPTPYHI